MTDRYPPVPQLRNSQAGLHAAITRIGWSPPPRRTVGRCASTLPPMVDGHTDLWCELAADHTGAHQDGTTTWMTRPKQEVPTVADRNSLYALAVNAVAERSPFGHPLAEAELRAVYAAVDAVADALESGGSR